MPYDPARPAEHAELKSQVMRNQLNALKDLIDAVLAGPPGSNGSDETLGAPEPPGQSVAKCLGGWRLQAELRRPGYGEHELDGSNVHFQFGIPCLSRARMTQPAPSVVGDGMACATGA